MEDLILEELKKYGGEIYKGLSKNNRLAFNGLCSGIASRLCMRVSFVTEVLMKEGF